MQHQSEACASDLRDSSHVTCYYNDIIRRIKKKKNDTVQYTKS